MGSVGEDFTAIDESFRTLYNDQRNQERVKVIEEHLGEPITPPTGKTKQFCLIGEGNLKKICRKVPKDRYFVLFSHQLIYCNYPPQDRNMRRPLLRKNVLNTCGMEVEELKSVQVGDVCYENCLQIKTSEKSFVVVMESAEEQGAWFSYMRSAIAHSNHNYNLASKSKKEGAAAPVWIPDQNYSVCPVCIKTKFTAINRRHHCRRCGTLMCGDCQRIQEDKNKKKKEKVCYKCANPNRASALQAPSQMVPEYRTVSSEEKAQLAKEQQELAMREKSDQVPASLELRPRLDSDTSSGDD